MAGRWQFWAGVASGAALMAFWQAMSREGRLEIARSGSGDRPYPLRYEGIASPVRLRREESENAGDPAMLTPSRGDTAYTGFERPGGAPGPNREPEQMEAPGRPGESLDHSDPSQGVRPATRSLSIHE